MTKINRFIVSHVKLIVASILFLLTYLPTLIWMWDRWFARDSYYSHGILIPFVTGFLIWQDKEMLAKMKIKSSSWGIPVIMAGIGLHLLSSLFRVYFSSGFSMLIVLIGMVLYFYGVKILRAVLFPILFLLFMFPVPLVVIANISFKMKLFAAKIATASLNGMGLPAIQEGSQIRMRHALVIVDDVCSGLRSLISLTALGSIFAYWMKSSMLRKILLFCSTAPIAVLTNVFRIIFLASIAEIWGPERAVGFVHDVSGFLVFAFAFLMLYVMGQLLE